MRSGPTTIGTAARAALEAEGVDVTELRTLPDQATGVALILVDATGENSIAVAGGANAGARAGARRASRSTGSVPAPGDVVLVGHEIPTATATEALRFAKAAGATTVFNPAPATGVGPETLALADILTPNEGEAAQLAGHDGEPEALGASCSARIAGGGHVLVTLGARGALLVGQEGATVDPGRRPSPWSTRSAPATRSMARSRPGSPPACPWRRRPAAPSRPLRWRSRGRARARGCRPLASSRRSLAG